MKDWLQGKNGGRRWSRCPTCSTAGREAFLAHHADQKAAADRAYLTSWALAHYLTFDRRVIGTAKVPASTWRGEHRRRPAAGVRGLVGQDLAAFEKDWHAYLLKLQPNGTVGK